jgi:hypothetical protein
MWIFTIIFVNLTKVHIYDTTDQELLKQLKSSSFLSMEKIMTRKVTWAVEKQATPPKNGKQLLKMQLRSLQTTTGLILLTTDRCAFLCFKHDGVCLNQVHNVGLTINIDNWFE